MDLPCQLGPYRLLRRLGQGGMAEVYLARAYGASGFEKQVAIKVLLPELRGHGESERALIAEARLGARLVHRNLVGVHDLGTDGGIYYVRMDYVDGPDLATVLRAGRPDPALALLLIEEVAQALAYMHKATDEVGRPLGLVHRDVSPSNVLISRDGEVKLADLGIAKATLLAEVTRGNVRKGKYAYMSPEQVAGEPLTRCSDQFALGTTLAELLCGRRPFDGETVLQTMDLIRAAAPPDLFGLPAPQEELISRCLSRHPADRYPDDAALLGAIRRAQQGLPRVSLQDLARHIKRCGA